MNSRIAILIFTICIIYTVVKETKAKQLIVSEKNQEKFGLPPGTVLEFDKRTQLAIPPSPSGNFTNDDRLELMWNNKKTRNSYCKVGPGKLKGTRMTYNYFWRAWCRNNDGENICCDNKTCHCDEDIPMLRFDCECLSKEELLDD